MKLLLATFLLTLALKAVLRVQERRRWVREGERGFDAFFAAGAPLRHDRLVAAFEDPGSVDHKRGSARVVRLGAITLPSGRVSVLTGDELDLESGEGLDVEFPAGVPLDVEGLVVGDDPTNGYAALRIRVGDGEPHTLEAAMSSSGRDYAARARELPALSFVEDQDVLVHSPEALDVRVERIAARPDVRVRVDALRHLWKEVELKWPRRFHEQKGAPPPGHTVSGEDGGLGIVVVQAWDMAEFGEALIQRDADGNLLAFILDFGAFGEPTWDWPPAA